MQHGLLKWLDPVLLIGLFISIAVATGMIVLGNDTVQSFIVGLLSTIIALLVDIITRIQRTEYSVLEATRLSQIVSDENISPFLLRVAQHYHNIKAYKFDTYTKLTNDKLTELEAQLRNIALGSATVSSRSIYDYTSEGIRQAKMSIRVVSNANEFEYWRSSRGAKYLSSNQDAIQRGVRFTRIFAIDYSLARQNIDVLRQQEAVGVNVFVVSPDRIAEEMLIFDDKVLLIYEQNASAQTRLQTIILDLPKIRRRIDEFDYAIQLGRTIKDLESMS